MSRGKCAVCDSPNATNLHFGAKACKVNVVKSGEEEVAIERGCNIHSQRETKNPLKRTIQFCRRAQRSSVGVSQPDSCMIVSVINRLPALSIMVSLALSRCYS